jgi:hypothetical protein
LAFVWYKTGIITLSKKLQYILLQDLPPKLYDGAENPVGLLSLFCPNANTPAACKIKVMAQSRDNV